MAKNTRRKHFDLPLKTIAEVAPITPKKCTYGGLLGSYGELDGDAVVPDIFKF